ncbi:Ras guanine nucleotide exchange factor [Metarhizium album ARSEF 1941]|uniref:Ras guanine nucleotide exchange factor n=1 Tax=Metarhizium album (strain ARSEF 1941) TaxID=1081103 RepID=A0A0B2WT82_METAS|nr:Ras guanine nucleotide exchange factor [Metarhizium album ARSEF 1941]KHN99241.1 Ras guanine nucleotide exchange factor [Metarhizium album ARSEF 1941]
MLSGRPSGANTRMAHEELALYYSSDRVSDGSYDSHQHTTTLYSHSHMTPPTTPNSSQEDLFPEPTGAPVFHNFLRTFYPFHPSYTVSDSSVTLPLEEGDVILVHSVHTNGWADGTLLASGARGWLPTNYCEAYEPEDMRNLLKALLNFWDLLRSTSVNDSEMFRNQEFMKGIIAGVRFLLERTGCLNRESSVVQRSDTLRKGRKSLLSELSLLVKTAKRLQESQNGTLYPPEDANDIIDEMILRAFKIVTKGVRFLDALEEDRRARVPASVTVMATVAEESFIPPTPPADRAHFEDQNLDNVSTEAGSHAATTDEGTSVTGMAVSESIEGGPNSPGPWAKRMSSLNAPINHGPSTGSGQNSNPQGSLQSHRLSVGMAHRVSLAGPSPLSRPQHLVSERLNRSHDKFLSHLGSFIGRLHLQSQSRPELSFAIKQSAICGGELLAVMDGVCAYKNSSLASLGKVRIAMFERIQALVTSARDTLANAATEGADLIMPQDNGILLMAATGCVRVAGECVAKTKVAIERVGDFEFELEGFSLGIDLSILDIAEERARTPLATERSDMVVSTAKSFQTSESSFPAPRRLVGPFAAAEKPLPRVPRLSIPENIVRQFNSPISSRPSSVHDDNASSVASSVSSIRPALPTLPKSANAPSHSGHDESSIDAARMDQEHAAHFDSLVASSAASSGTYLSRDSESSVLSQTSTRATTPDQCLAPRNQPSMSDMSVSGSLSQTDEQDDVETRLLEKTFAHELMFNKEGQVTGGSLPALVERLTTHESTPDATFVSTFFLTFRLFCTPIKLTEALIERFEYVGEFPHMAGPVRLRVYNAFKGWLESHWRDQTDREALKLIIPFAELKLISVLSSAGRRLLELAKKVSGQGSLVPRLVSSMGKTNTSIAQYVPADAPLPHPAISKGQQHLLTAFRTGGNGPTLLDLDPLELARQLTIKQMSIFCSILPEELLSSQWMKKGGVDAPNVKAMSALSTDLSNLVAETILQHSEIKKRAAIIKQWIKIAYQCLELHNYDGLMAIICTLNSSTISRLRKTWDAVSSKRKDMLRLLQGIVEPAQNNKVLRTRLHDHVPPCLPFLGMYLTDLTFVDIGNPATKQMSLGTDGDEDGSGGLTVVNFDKHTRTAKIIGDLQRFQIPYRLMEVREMQEWITAQIRRVREGDQGNVQVTYYRKSLLLEPRESASRRETEPPTPVSSGTGPSRGDLFGWMSRDRGQTPTPAQG